MDKVFHCPKVSLAKIFSGEVKLPRLCGLRVHQESLLSSFSGPKSYKTWCMFNFLLEYRTFTAELPLGPPILLDLQSFVKDS